MSHSCLSETSRDCGLHYQMTITQVHRAWEGGLRLISHAAIRSNCPAASLALLCCSRCRQSDDTQAIVSTRLLSTLWGR